MKTVTKTEILQSLVHTHDVICEQRHDTESRHLLDMLGNTLHAR